MHRTALKHAKLFFDTYVDDDASVMELGAQDVNGSLRSVARGDSYVGVDFVEGKGVDLVIKDPYQLPFDDESFDVVVTSSCFEHSEFFWLVFLEVLRTLKPGGLAYINVPSNGLLHRYPVDCWRFYPDSGLALQNWGRRNDVPVTLLESFTGYQDTGLWNDFVAVFAKGDHQRYTARMQQVFSEYMNGYTLDDVCPRNEVFQPQDQRRSRLHWRLLRLLHGGAELEHGQAFQERAATRLPPGSDPMHRLRQAWSQQEPCAARG